MKKRTFLTLFAVWVAFQAAFFYASFFWNLHSTISEWAGYGINWPIQLFHNFLHGRPLQSSLYASPTGGPAVGFVDNPYAYVHSFVVHVTVFPYLFALIWGLWPTVPFLYAIIIAWNLVAGLWLTRAILKRLDPKTYRSKFLFAASVYVGAGLLSILDQFAQPLLFAGPLMLAAYHFFLTRRRFWFLTAIAAICLTGEDASMMAVTMAAYFFLFEGREGRGMGTLAAGISVPYMLAVLFVVQPAARADLTVLSATNMSHAFKHLLEITPEMVAQNVKTLWPLFTIFPAFLMAGGLFGRPGKRELGMVAGLTLVTAAPYWVEGFTRGGGHHILPPFVSCYLGLLRLIGPADASEPDWSGRKVSAAVLGATAVFILFSLRVQANNLPNAVKPGLYRLSGKQKKGEALERSLKVEEASNRAVIAAIRGLPADKTLTYLTNNQATGFFLDRTDVWQCADMVGGRFAFEKTDYYVVQKDGVSLTCCLLASAGDDFPAVVRSSPDISGLDCPMTPDLLGKIRAYFVASGSHRVLREDEHVLILENRAPVKFVSPPQTVGLGWTRNLFKKAKMAAVPVR